MSMYIYTKHGASFFFSQHYRNSEEQIHLSHTTNFSSNKDLAKALKRQHSAVFPSCCSLPETLSKLFSFLFHSQSHRLFCLTPLLLFLSGSEAAAVGLHPGQCILKVNGSNASHGNYMDVLEHFTAYRTKQQEVLV